MLRQSNRAAWSLARRLLAHETEHGRQDLEASADAAERTGDKLRLHLTKIIGPAGFRVLLARALTLARADHAWLAPVEAEQDGTLKGLRAAAEGQEPAEAAAGFAAVMAHTLGLLALFIGDDLTRRLVRQVWPEAGPGDGDSNSEEEAEQG